MRCRSRETQTKCVAIIQGRNQVLATKTFCCSSKAGERQRYVDVLMCKWWHITHHYPLSHRGVHELQGLFRTCCVHTQQKETATSIEQTHVYTCKGHGMFIYIQMGCRHHMLVQVDYTIVTQQKLHMCFHRDRQRQRTSYSLSKG